MVSGLISDLLDSRFRGNDRFRGNNRSINVIVIPNWIGNLQK